MVGVGVELWKFFCEQRNIWQTLSRSFTVPEKLMRQFVRKINQSWFGLSDHPPPTLPPPSAFRTCPRGEWKMSPPCGTSLHSFDDEEEEKEEDEEKSQVTLIVLIELWEERRRKIGKLIIIKIDSQTGSGNFAG